MSEMHLKQPRFTYSVEGAFSENKERIQKIRRNRGFKTCLSKRTRQNLLLA